MIAAKETATDRWFVRCSDCLAVSAIELEREPRGRASEPRGAECGACGGALETMGRVVRERFVLRTVEACPCDERCTNALGPNCDCSCGGANHGTRRVGFYDVTGPKPKVTPVNAEKSRTIAAEWRAAYGAALERIAPLGRWEFEAKRRGEWLSGREYGRLCNYMHALREVQGARALRTHKGRLDRLKKLTAACAAAGAGGSA